MSRRTPEQLRQEDAEARRLAQAEFDRPLVLVAGAGTGKTTVLVARIVGWCLGRGWARAAPDGIEESADGPARRVLERIGAITFTEKAAAEMGSRVAEAFATIGRGQDALGIALDLVAEPQEVLQERARALARNLDALQTTTIHSFCHRLLSRHALEAGLHPEFDLDADQRQLRRIVREVVAERLPAQLGEDADEDAVRLLAEDVTPERIVEAVDALARSGVAPERLAEDPFPPETVRRTARALIDDVERLRAKLAPGLGNARFGNAKGLAATWDALTRFVAPPEAPHEAAELRPLFEPLLEPPVLATLKAWAKGEINKTTAKLLGEVVIELPELSREAHEGLHRLVDFDPAHLRAGARLVGPLLIAVDDRRRRLGVLTFSDLLIETARLLEDSPLVTASLRESLDLLLVDEFQDTDPIQYLIVEHLALRGPADQRPSLFLVGDPKQSIYAWRGADLAAFESFLEKVRAQKGRRLGLYVNYRSVPEILDEVSRVIGPAMVQQAGIQPAFEPLVPAVNHGSSATRSDEDRGPVEHWIAWDEEAWGTKAETARRLEATAIARDLRRLHDADGVAWGDAALLLRSRSRFETYLEALRAEGVPYQVSRDRSYFRRREVQEAIALVTVVLDPQDHVALTAFLRSAAVGVPDAALIPLWQEELPALVMRLPGDEAEVLVAIDQVVERVRRKLPAGLPGHDRIPDWPVALRGALRFLSVLRRSFATESADRFLERLRRGAGTEILAAGRYLGALRLANLEKFHRDLLDRLRDLQGGAQELLRELRRAEAGEYEESEAGPPGDEADLVRVMTIHQAKGLTFGHTYVAGLHAPIGIAPRKGLETKDEALWSEEGLELRLFGQCTLGHGRIEQRRRETEAAEAVRILYVAMTRPRHRLVLAGRWPDPTKPPRQPAQELVDHCAGREGGAPPLTELAESAGGINRVDGLAWKHLAAAAAGQEESQASRKRPETGLRPESLLRRARGSEARHSAAKLRSMKRRTGAMGTSRGMPHPPPGPDEPDLGEEPFVLSREGVDHPALFGSLVHAIAERCDYRLEGAGLRDHLEELATALARELVPPAVREELTGELVRWSAGWSASSLFARLVALEKAGAVLARELPVMAAPTEEDLATGALVGAIDLLYREPESGQIVIADFKTDRLHPKRSAEVAAREHEGQLGAYRRALALWLGPGIDPRGEIWFLQHDRVVVPS